MKFGRFLAVGCVLVFAVACVLSPVRQTTVSPTGRPQPRTPAVVLSPTPTQPSNPDVLSACDLSSQAQAMRAGQIPDWRALALSTCYDLTLNLEADGRSYTGAARITYANLTSTPLNDLVFRLYPNAPVIYGGILSVEMARVDGKAVTPQVFLADHTALRLILPQPLAVGASTVVEMNFTGQAAQDYGSDQVYGIFNLSSSGPVLALADWYPLLAVHGVDGWVAGEVLAEGDAVVSESELYRVTLNVPKEWKVAATGSLLESHLDGERWTGVYASGPVREFTIAASPVFEQTTMDAGGVQVNHWGLPEEEAPSREVLSEVAAAVKVFDQDFGLYPFAELDTVAVPLQNAGGVEYPGLVFLEAGLYGDTTQRNYLQIATAHEVSHQWWYSVIGNDVLQHPWQDEAMATFSSLLFYERTNEAFFEGTLAYYQDRVKDVEKQPGDDAVGQPLSAFVGEENNYGAVVYLRGAIFLFSLRDEIGDEAFFNGLKSYYHQNEYQLTQPEALLGSFEAACSCDLTAFYQQWGVIP